MKFCYLDETGTGQDTVVIVAGVIVDVIRMNRTKQEWESLFDQVSRLSKKPITEMHAKDLIPGNGEWYGVDPQVRDEVVDTILDWLTERNHKVTFSAVDRARFKASSDDRVHDLRDEWCAASFHVVLTLQKAHKSISNNKGHTLLIFDKGKDPTRLISLLRTPPDWSDSYYSRAPRQIQLDQIVDVPYFADSKFLPLIQIADLIGYILRRYADLHDYESTEKYDGELIKYERWIGKIRGTCLKTSMRYMKHGGCDTSKFYRELAPESLRYL